VVNLLFKQWPVRILNELDPRSENLQALYFQCHCPLASTAGSLIETFKVPRCFWRLCHRDISRGATFGGSRGFQPKVVRFLHCHRREATVECPNPGTTKSNRKHGICERGFKRRSATREGWDIPFRWLNPTATVIGSLRDQGSRAAANRRRQGSGVDDCAVTAKCVTWTTQRSAPVLGRSKVEREERLANPLVSDMQTLLRPRTAALRLCHLSPVLSVFGPVYADPVPGCCRLSPQVEVF